MDDIFTLLRMFPFNPVAALIVAGIFSVGSLVIPPGHRKRKAPIIAAIAWGVYTIWEVYILNWRSPTGDRAIRVDLVLLAPIMLSVAVMGARALFGGTGRDNSSYRLFRRVK